MKLYVIGRNYKKEVIMKNRKEAMVSDLLKELELLNECFIVTHNDKLLIESDVLKNNDKIKLVPVVSNG